MAYFYYGASPLCTIYTERDTIIAARAVSDEMTANIMIPLLQGSEDGIVLYESYLKLIEQMGLDNF